MKYLSSLVFISGAVTLGVELSAARLLEPVFGNNQIVWAALIGLILLYLALGAWLGGKLADRFPQVQLLERVIVIGALGVALIPVVSGPVLRWAATGIDNFDGGLLAGALLAMLLLFSLPIVLLGTVSPWAVRLAVNNVAQAGQIAGRLYAIATAGSLFGTFLPVLWLIPAYGTRRTFFCLACLPLVVIGTVTLRSRRRWWPLAALLLLVGLWLWGGRQSSIRAGWDDGQAGALIYEDESFYNYIAVRQWGSERHLKLNDGIGIHSVSHPDSVLSLGIWDYFLLAPLFRAEVQQNVARLGQDPAPLGQLLIIGLAAGTVSELYSKLYGPLPITGIELDREIITVGQQYFGMTQPNLTAIAADGRHWLAGQPPTATWDLIAIDAYRPPYIPFQLTTVEFFSLVRDHLSADGVVAINVGRTATNYALVDSLAATLYQLFPTVYAIDEPGPADNLSNSLLVATRRPVDLAAFAQTVAALPPQLPAPLRTFAADALAQTRLLPPPASSPFALPGSAVTDATIFTDDHAPVEWVVHRSIWDFMLRAD